MACKRSGQLGPARRNWMIARARLSGATMRLFSPLQHRRFSSSAPRPKVLVIGGATATGKSALALRMAEKMGGEIISADAVQVFKGLDVGSGKVNAETRGRIPHHMLDVVDADEHYSVGDYEEQARACMEDIISSGKVPIVVGGAGMHIRWLMYGRQTCPPYTGEMRDHVAQLLAEDSDWDRSLERLVRIDPEYASTLCRNNYQRLSRALEIVLASGKPMKHFDEQSQRTLSELPYDFRCFHLRQSRKKQCEKSDLRTEKLFLAGFIEEVVSLLEAGKLRRPCTAAKSLGYRSILQLLEDASKGELYPEAKDMEALIHTVQAKTRQFARRQALHFRNEEGFYEIKGNFSAELAISTAWQLPARLFRTEIDRQHKFSSMVKPIFSPPHLQTDMKYHQSQLTVTTRADLQRYADAVRRHVASRRAVNAA